MTNNSLEMKTQVETYIIEETQELIYDNEKLDQWNGLVSELGLKGQTNIAKPQKSPIPFLHMKPGLVNIFRTLCPRQVDIMDYAVTPIPVEILKLASLSVKEQYFQKIEIWYDDVKPDPACVGITGHWYESYWHSDSNQAIKNEKYTSKQEVIDAGGKHPSFSETAKYLIGKWADVKHSFEELRQIATKRYCEDETNELEKKIKEAKRELDDLKSKAHDMFK